jgi:mono/diheme cytochrome c family protein
MFLRLSSALSPWSIAGTMALGLVAGCASSPRSAAQTPTAASSTLASSSSEGAPAETAAAPADGDERRHIMTIHHNKCGNCHTPVAPGSVPRAEATAAMHRHRRRAKLSEREWNDMVEYISDDGDLRGQPTARLP